MKLSMILNVLLPVFVTADWTITSLTYTRPTNAQGNLSNTVTFSVNIDGSNTQCNHTWSSTEQNVNFVGTCSDSHTRFKLSGTSDGGGWVDVYRVADASAYNHGVAQVPVSSLSCSQNNGWIVCQSRGGIGMSTQREGGSIP
ncbi:hypothetical protein BT63DRAFT_457334 [Microthyrium microscopicum]|uniref:AA1-like domain-containing protein n=1 Tax=Microthyrium microscopicum TaxID=703497 RepID=A0A6A6UAU7_9PEZI|nr:hypothetical protein BT63DRAFT_457334 [Microthyrium microscopicum]